MQTNKIKKSGLKSRKFWVALVTFLTVLGNEYFGIEIDPANLALVVLPIITWLIGESLIDAVKK